MGAGGAEPGGLLADGGESPFAGAADLDGFSTDGSSAVGAQPFADSDDLGGALSLGDAQDDISPFAAAGSASLSAAVADAPAPADDFGDLSPFAGSAGLDGADGASPFAASPGSGTDGAAFAGAPGAEAGGAGADPYRPYVVNTFEGAPVRLAIFAHMPALRGVRSLTFACSGLDGGEPWEVESEAGDFSMPDWTFTAPSWQLFDIENGIAEGGSIGDRFIVLSLPFASEGARIRLERIVLSMEDGRELVLENADPSDAAIQIIDAPPLH
jgi:hypothetical protein